MMWLSDYSTPSLEGYHKYGALTGPGQTTGSTGGFDYWDDSGKARVVLRIMSLGLRMTF